MRDLGSAGPLLKTIPSIGGMKDDRRNPERMSGLKQLATLGTQVWRDGGKTDTKLKKEFEKWVERSLEKSKPVGNSSTRHAISLAVWQEKPRSRCKPAEMEFHCEECMPYDSDQPYGGGILARRKKRKRTEEDGTIGWLQISTRVA